MKKYDVYFNRYLSFNVFASVRTFLSSLLVRHNVGIESKVYEAINKQTNAKNNIGLQGNVELKVNKNTGISHMMALYTDVGLSAIKKESIISKIGSRIQFNNLFYNLLSKNTINHNIGVRYNIVPIFINGSYNINSLFGIAHNLIFNLIKSVSVSQATGIIHNIAVCVRKASGFFHNIGLSASINKIVLRPNIRQTHQVGIYGSVTPLYVSLRTIGEMQTWTLGQMQSMTLGEIKIKQTL